MQESDNVFRTGKYHKSFKKRHIHLIRKAQLRVFYRTSLRLITQLGWPNPLSLDCHPERSEGSEMLRCAQHDSPAVTKDAPQLLLCGTASPYTTATFARFVRKRNTRASITVLDISPYALSQSEGLLRTYQDIDQTRVSFVEGDALNMPFPDGYFDWIETDFFIQFFSAHEKVTLFKEWYQVLKPGGIVTTRDWLQRRQNFTERIIDRTRIWLIGHILGPIAYSASAQELKKTLNEIGFDVAFFPVKVPVINIRIPMMNYIILYKPYK